MSVRILGEPSEGYAFCCSTTGWAFGPMFDSYGAAQDFLDWLEAGVQTRRLEHSDPRCYRDLELRELYDAWTKDPPGEKGSA